MKNELISMGERNLQLDKLELRIGQDFDYYISNKWSLSIQYTKFCFQLLNISMFVPAIKVEDKWEVLEEFNVVPYNGHTDSCDCLGCNKMYKQYEQYQTAKDNVIFEGFEVVYNEDKSIECIESKTHHFYMGNLKDSTIQDLMKYKPTLTKNGVEVSGLNNK